MELDLDESSLAIGRIERALSRIEKALADEPPLGRLCAVQDIADAADFLLSGKASFITGQTLCVDGGRELL